jgi:hypothetical protein
MLPTGTVLVAAGNRLLRSTLVQAADNTRGVDPQIGLYQPCLVAQALERGLLGDHAITPKT